MSKPAGPSKTTTFDKAMALHQNGQLLKADKLYSKFLGKNPTHSDALHMRGVLKIAQGNYKLAEHLLAKALKSNDPDADPWIHFHHGQVLALTERHEPATREFEKAIESGAQDSDVYYVYANSLFELNRFAESIENYEHALKLQPQDIDCRLNLVNAYEAAGDYDAALHCLEPIAQATNASTHLKLQQAELLVSTKRAREAHAVVLKIVSPVSIDNVDPIMASARFMHKQVRHDSSEHLVNLIRPHFDSLNSHQRDLAVGLLNDLGHYRDSRQLLEHPNNHKRSAWSWFQEGLCCQVAGEFNEAANCHLKALSIDNTLGAAAYSLATNGNTQVSDELLKRWGEQIENTSTLPAQQAQFAFAVARTLDGRKEYERAFDHYQKGNQLSANLQPFNADRWDEYTNKVIETFSADFFDNKKEFLKANALSDEQAGSHLSFIVGMPRSGSTLLEQTLIKRAGVRGLGEHHAMRRIVADIPELTDFKRLAPECALDLQAEHVNDFRDQYLDSIVNQHSLFSPQNSNENAMTGPFVDKMLGNFVRLGIIALMFPKARILHSARDPMATAVSCYTNAFNSGLRFTYDLYSMGRAWQSYNRLMKHWHEVLPIPIMDVHYETMVSDTDNYFPTVLNFLNIAEVKSTDGSGSGDNNVSSEDQGNIATASFWQARQAISTQSVESWKRFDSHLDPLREGLNTIRHE